MTDLSFSFFFVRLNKPLQKREDNCIFVVCVCILLVIIADNPQQNYPKLHTQLQQNKIVFKEQISILR